MGIPPINLHLIFAILQFEKIEFGELDFFPSLNWIFLPAVHGIWTLFCPLGFQSDHTGPKNQVRQKN